MLQTNVSARLGIIYPIGYCIAITRLCFVLWIPTCQSQVSWEYSLHYYHTVSRYLWLEECHHMTLSSTYNLNLSLYVLLSLSNMLLILSCSLSWLLDGQLPCGREGISMNVITLCCSMFCLMIDIDAVLWYLTSNITRVFRHFPCIA